MIPRCGVISIVRCCCRMARARYTPCRTNCKYPSRPITAGAHSSATPATISSRFAVSWPPLALARFCRMELSWQALRFEVARNCGEFVEAEQVDPGLDGFYQE